MKISFSLSQAKSVEFFLLPTTANFSFLGIQFLKNFTHGDQIKMAAPEIPSPCSKPQPTNHQHPKMQPILLALYIALYTTF